MKKLLLALVLLLALATPALAVENVILYGAVVNNLEDDGSTTQALQLADGTVLPKVLQHPASMARLGEVPGRGEVYQWLDTPERVAVIRAEHAGAYLGAKIEDLPPEAADYVMEVEVHTTDEDGKPVVKRMKVADARAAGVDTAALEKIPPHEWQKEK